MRYEISSTMIGNYQAVVLRDMDADAEATIIPEIGANLIGCRLYGQEVIEGPPNRDLSMLAQHSSLYGTPLLWPPGRVRNGSFIFHDRAYQLPLNDRPHHLHGELRDVPWTIHACSADADEGAVVTLRHHTRDGRIPQMSYYPHPLLFHITYRLLGGELFGSLDVCNEGEDEAPFGFGLHPYFATGNSFSDVSITAPAVLEYAKDEQGFITEAPAHTKLCDQLRNGIQICALPGDVDHFLFRLADSKHRCEIAVDGSEKKIVFEFCDALSFMVLFKPSWLDAISVEPWSAAADPFNTPLPPEWTGASSLRPREHRTYNWRWRLE